LAAILPTRTTTRLDIRMVARNKS